MLRQLYYVRPPFDEIAMFCRALVLILLSSLLLTRSAMIGHAHGLSADPNRLTVHVHVGRFWHHESHEREAPQTCHEHHHHGHGGHSHSHHHHDEPDAPLPIEPTQDHDEDAIEIVVDDAISGISGVKFDVSHVGCSWLMLPFLQDAIHARHRSLHLRAHPPPDTFGGCPLHLLNLVLVI